MSTVKYQYLHGVQLQSFLLGLCPVVCLIYSECGKIRSKVGDVEQGRMVAQCVQGPAFEPQNFRKKEERITECFLRYRI